MRDIRTRVGESVCRMYANGSSTSPHCNSYSKISVAGSCYSHSFHSQGIKIIQAEYQSEVTLSFPCV
jgi:hypothetical protein